MKERPILFSGAMVRAILEGRKTVTRRAMKPQPVLNGNFWEWAGAGWSDRIASITPVAGHSLATRCPYGEPGDHLRVKEAAWMWCERLPNGLTPTGRQKWHYVPMREAPVIYAADHPDKPQTRIVSPDTGNEWAWRLKIGRFLPAWAVRIELEITAITIERLQDISAEQALAEGVQPFADGGFHVEDGRHYDAADPRLSFASLIESTTGDGLWNANPWVWVVEFKRVTP